MENGSQLGPYEIVERIGAGGMGEVYRARDSRLEREVAIKILPPAVAHDPNRLARFQEEARLLASVNHANIAAIHELDNANGVEFFAQELVPGISLSQRLKEGPLDLDEALDVARQIATALEVAHDNGLVHRDLKPSNVMLTPDMQVKVLDFGLAIPVTRESDDLENTATQEIPALARDDTPTVSVDTAPTVLTTGPRATGVEGTPPYMSPEQARGRMVDRRSDIWSFGCVLYEMLCARKCFSGDTPLDVLAAVVRADPDWSVLPRSTPAATRVLLQRTLRKDPLRRLQHIGEARVRLEEIAEGFEEERIVVDGGDRGLAVGAGVGWAAALLMIGGFTGAILQGAIFGGGRGATLSPDPVSASIALAPGQSLASQPFTSLAVSPDGRLIAFAAGDGDRHQLYLRRLDDFEPIPVPGSEGGTSPFFSPDGQWLGFFANGYLMRLPTAGGAPEQICEVPVGNTGATWTRDGRIIFGTFQVGDGLKWVRATGGEATPLTRPEPDRFELEHNWPSILPDDDTLIFTSRGHGGSSSIHALRLSGRERQRLLENVSDARYHDGYLLYSQAGELHAIQFDAATLQTVGSPVRLLPGVFVTQGGRASFAASPAGTLVFAPGDPNDIQQRLVWVSRDGSVEPLEFGPGRFGHPRLAPDDTRLATDDPVEGSIRIFDLRRGSIEKLRVPGFSAMPVWDTDGNQILMSSQVDGPAALYELRADGGGRPILALAGEQALWPRSFTEVGIAYYELNSDPASGRDIFLLGDDRRPRSLVATEHNERSPMISPDSRFVAYVSDENGRDEVYVRMIDQNDDRRWPISINGGREPVWSREGGELFYRHGHKMMSVAVATRGAPEFGVPVELFERRFAYDHVASNQYYDVALDGRFLMILPDERRLARDHVQTVLNFDRLMQSAISGGDNQ